MLKFDCRYRLVGGDECQGFDNPVGKIDILQCRPLARMGYFDYTSVESVFEIAPGGPDIEKIRRGLEGRARGKGLAE